MFAFEESYRQDANAPVLSFKAFRDPVTGLYRDVIRPTRTRAHPYFANLLPEGPLRTYLAEHAKINPARDFPFLWLLGNDLPGALILRDHDGVVLPPAEHEQRAVSANGESDERVLRFSLAGVQLKFSAIGNERSLTIPVEGMGGSWIVKLPDQRYTRVPENEFSMMTFAKRIGIDVPRIALTDLQAIAGLPRDIRNLSGAAFIIERFDRIPDGERIHTEDFAQANILYPQDNYRHFNFDMLVEQVADLMGLDAALEIIGRIVFSIGIGNGDMHAKNWSVIYRDGKTPSVAPAYDCVSTIVYMPDDDLGMNLAGTKAYADIDDERFARLAKHARLPTKPVIDAVHEMVDRMQELWPQLAPDLPMSAEQRAMLTDHMNSLPLFSRRAATARY